MPHIQAESASPVPAFLQGDNGHVSGTTLLAAIFGVMIAAQVLAVAIFLVVRRFNAHDERIQQVDGMHLSFLAAVESQRNSPVAAALAAPAAASAASSASSSFSLSSASCDGANGKKANNNNNDDDDDKSFDSNATRAVWTDPSEQFYLRHVTV